MKCLCLFLAFCLFVLPFSLVAQRGPLRGSGKIVEKSFDFKGFDKVDIKDLNGKIKIQTGKSFAVSIKIDDNLESLLQASVENGTLIVSFKNNENNKMYIEDTHIELVITMPEISVVKHRGNTNVTIDFGTGRYLRIDNDGNGDIMVKGVVDQFDLINDGNGDIEAASLIAKTAEVEKFGNGDVIVNVSDKLSVKARGNGNIINKGKADFTVRAKSGNGDLIKKN